MLLGLPPSAVSHLTHIHSCRCESCSTYAGHDFAPSTKTLLTSPKVSYDRILCSYAPLRQDLRERYARVEVRASAPLVTFKESLALETPDDQVRVPVCACVFLCLCVSVCVWVGGCVCVCVRACSQSVRGLGQNGVHARR
jgi:hypothetical protein